ncbi:hypothetical protein B0A58_04740 [Flavobacterium branchiophilum NBRC 15030 = ATCC 35035]|uniref:Methionyl-tRNA formyltransferase n=1 Tax=Flavobacterium branchiophilum TaxID=55197 RepID=A0A543G5B7_9FLAO|nr:formyltransferase family protein [Flavobacterium branchiophilum]OXA78052.1 hypothetical protein B0A58_04740 [Flavobacterium branchiophilum NBRC 15030 = ATCC 35035]TQM41273.1 methionyl-tRNA formyltransferase [Flavobacterium branchiophilum]GEM54853.1 hypothetical protein FB1_10740 [Flavobacterium branchiophilum NBRC 15030 = ATCC 35035]
MKIIILTSSTTGVAAHHLPYLLEHQEIDVAMVVVSKGILQKKQSFFKNKLKKIFKIGILGSINGLRMRKWYSSNTQKYHKIIPLDVFCKAKNIPFFEVEVTNSEQTMQLFRNSGADLGISLGNGFISKRVFSIPRFGMINIHHEILPDYQNAQSVIWQIYNRSKNSGFTIHQIDSKIDTGAIIYQEKVPIIFKSSLKDTVTNTLCEIENKSALGLLKVLKNFDYYFNNKTPQGAGNHYTTPSIRQYFVIYKNYLQLKKSE